MSAYPATVSDDRRALPRAAARATYCDPRPLYPAARPLAPAWHSPTFWLASALVLPCAAVAMLVRGVARLG